MDIPSREGERMSLLYPQFLWLLIPFGLLFLYLKPNLLIQRVHLIILLLLVFTLTRPQLQKGFQEESIEAKEVLIALDVSYSMRATDVKPTRYDYAKATIDTLLRENVQDNIMLIAFTTNPLLLSPPTTDHILVRTALNALDLNNILTKGTSLEKLFKKISSMKKVHRELLLITDGGEEKDLKRLTTALEDTDIHLTILALGSKQGTTIPTEDGSMLKDSDNHLVVSRINPLLKELAQAMNGTYLTASGNPQSTSDAINRSFSQSHLEAKRVNKLHYTTTELYQIPLLLALLLFLMLHTRASKYLLILFALLGIPLQASFLDTFYLDQAYHSYEAKEYNTTKRILAKIETPSLQKQFALANTFYKLHQYKKAIALYSAIHSTSASVKQKLYYNIANAYAMQRAYDKAKIYYTRALQLGDDEDALHNLKIIALLKKKKRAELGISHPKSQSNDSSKSNAEKGSQSKKTQDEEQQSSGSGSGGEKQESTKKKQEKQKLILDKSEEQQPLSSKVYELINKGYIHETHPW